MSKRTYQQYCGLARALDVLGERWTLLILRNLFLGPQRYTDLLGGLPGIGTDLLTARLRDLEKEGLVRRHKLPPPAASWVYELTESAHELRPALIALAKWGTRLLGEPEAGDVFQAEWGLLAIAATFDPAKAKRVRATYEFRVDDKVFYLRIDRGAVELQMGPAPAADVTIACDTQTFVRLASKRLTPEDALRIGRVSLEGDPIAFSQGFEMFGLSPS